MLRNLIETLIALFNSSAKDMPEKDFDLPLNVASLENVNGVFEVTRSIMCL